MAYVVECNPEAVPVRSVRASEAYEPNEHIADAPIVYTSCATPDQVEGALDIVRQIVPAYTDMALRTWGGRFVFNDTTRKLYTGALAELARETGVAHHVVVSVFAAVYGSVFRTHWNANGETYTAQTVLEPEPTRWVLLNGIGAIINHGCAPTARWRHSPGEGVFHLFAGPDGIAQDIDITVDYLVRTAYHPTVRHNSVAKATEYAAMYRRIGYVVPHPNDVHTITSDPPAVIWPNGAERRAALAELLGFHCTCASEMAVSAPSSSSTAASTESARERKRRKRRRHAENKRQRKLEAQRRRELGLTDERTFAEVVAKTPGVREDK